MFPADTNLYLKLTSRMKSHSKKMKSSPRSKKLMMASSLSISDSELISGWWSGVNTAGQSGLFPSNYCEMLPDGEISEADQAPPPQAEAEDLEAVPPVAPPPPPPPPPMPGSAPAASEEEHMVAQYE
jgi:hypothetical protein